MRIYKDIKEFPVFNFERIEETGDFFYMIKGYDGEGKEKLSKKYDENRLKDLYNEFIQSIDLGSINTLGISIIERNKMNVEILEQLLKLIELNSGFVGVLSEEELIERMTPIFQSIKIPIKKTFEEQVKIIENRIAKYVNDINERVSILKKNAKKSESESDKNSVLDLVLSIEIILETTIDLHNTSIYKLMAMKKQANKKIESIENHNNKK